MVADILDLAPEDLVEVDGLDLAPSPHPDHCYSLLPPPLTILVAGALSLAEEGLN